MNGPEYKKTREEIGSQAYVANLLDVDKSTVSRRERSFDDVSREAELALLHLRDNPDIDKELQSIEK